MNADTLLYLIEWGVLINLCILPIVSFMLLTRPPSHMDTTAALTALRAVEEVSRDGKIQDTHRNY